MLLSDLYAVCCWDSLMQYTKAVHLGCFNQSLVSQQLSIAEFRSHTASMQYASSDPQDILLEIERSIDRYASPRFETRNQKVKRIF